MNYAVMRFIVSVCLVAICIVYVPQIAEGHDPLPVCGKSPQIAWDANTELDMAFYSVYVHTATDVLNTQAQVFQVPHNGKTIVVERGKGFFASFTQVVMHGQTVISLAEGPVYFGVTAVDEAGNESEPSSVIGCEVIHPVPPLSAPTKFKMTLSVEP